MRKNQTPSFIAELPLVVNSHQERQLLLIFEISRKLYNAALGDGLKKIRLMKQSKAWQAARLMKPSADKTNAFKEIISLFSFTKNDTEKFLKECKNNSGWNNLIGSHIVQKIAELAFNACSNYCYGKKGKPRFKGSKRPIKSIVGKNNQTNIVWDSSTEQVKLGKIILSVIMPTIKQDNYLLEALISKTKYCRILWRKVKGKYRWYVQLTQEGFPPSKSKNYTQKGHKVGLDIGPSTIAAVATNPNNVWALFSKFCQSIEYPYNQIKLNNRAIERSKRATNPQCYNNDGGWKKGAKFAPSKHCKELRIKSAEINRKLASARKTEHGKLANEIIRHGNIIQTEKISYKSFQKNFGRSVSVRAPGMFINLLKYKAEKAGGELIELNTWLLKMSQYDHTTDSYTKKKLSQRTHNLGDGTSKANRDIYSAFLAGNIDPNINKHNPSNLATEWTSLEPVLRQMGLCVRIQTTSSIPVKDEICSMEHQSGSFVKENLLIDYDQDVVRNINRSDAPYINESLKTCFLDNQKNIY